MSSPSENGALEAELQKLALKPELTIEETRMVLQSIPLIVVADDTPGMCRALLRRIGGRAGLSHMNQLEGSVPECFEQLADADPGKISTISCADSTEAREAIEQIRGRMIERAVLLFDNNMGHPTGLELLTAYNEKLPHGIARALQTGINPGTLEENVQQGILDVAVLKPHDKAIECVTEAFLKRNYGINAK